MTPSDYMDICEQLSRDLSTCREALEYIAAYHDTNASHALLHDKSYALFDEPNSVRIAREALARTSY